MHLDHWSLFDRYNTFLIITDDNVKFNNKIREFRSSSLMFHFLPFKINKSKVLSLNNYKSM